MAKSMMEFKIFNRRFIVNKTSRIKGMSCEYFNVTGAGEIQLSNSSEGICGGVKGFHIGVSWGEYGYAGGILSKEEAKKLAEHILKNI